MDANNNGDRPTAKQLAYLRSLANRAGQTFTYPRTRGQASREIQRLKQASRAHAPSARSSARRSPTRSPTARRTPRASRDREVDGYGSSATWKERS